MALEITDNNFEEVINTDKTILVDFWAEWCGPCKMIGPVVEELAGEYEGKAVVGKVNVDENPNTAQKFGTSAKTSNPTPANRRPRGLRPRHV